MEVSMTWPRIPGPEVAGRSDDAERLYREALAVEKRVLVRARRCPPVAHFLVVAALHAPLAP